MTLAVRIASLALIVVIIAFGAVAILLWTQPGQSAIKNFIESRLGAALGGEAEIGRLSGDLPRHIVLNDVTLEAGGESWLRIDRLVVNWRPLKLATGAISIDALIVDGAILLELPPGRKDSPPRGFELPDALPDLTIRRLEVRNLRVAEGIAGQSVVLNGDGSVAMGGADLRVEFDAASETGTDNVLILVARDVGSQRLTTDITILSRENGAISAIAGADGPIEIAVRGDGPASDYRLTASASIGAYGSLDAVVSGNLRRMQRLFARGRAQFGEKLDDLAKEFGPRVRFNLAFVPLDDGSRIEIGQIQSDLLTAEGSVVWKNQGGVLDRINIDIKTRFADDWRPDIQRLIGDRATISGTARRDGDYYDLTGALTTPLLSLALDEARTDLERSLQGLASLVLEPNGALPPGLKEGARASGLIDLDLNDAASISQLALTTPEHGAFDGDITYDFESRRVSAEGELAAPPSMITAIAPSIAPAGPIVGAVAIEGAVDDFAAEATIRTPAIAIEGERAPPLRARLSLTGLPGRPSGSIEAAALKGEGRFSTKVRTLAEGEIRLSDLAYSAPKFRLQGDLAFNPETHEIAARARYRGEEGAEPWPGLPLAGELTVVGAIDRDEDVNRLTIESDRLASDRWMFDGLKAVVTGPMDDLAIDLTASELAVSGTPAASDLVIAAAANLEGPPKIVVSRLNAKVSGPAFSLASPFTLAFEDGVRIDGLDARFGADGRISLDATIGAERWLADMSLQDVPVPMASSAIDLTLALDTDASVPAAGAITLTSLLTAEERASISGKLTWNGQAINIRNNVEGDNLVLDLSYPLRLSKQGGAIKLDNDGPLSGTARYDGRLETIAPFLPTIAQSLEGGVDLSLTLRGTTADPKLSGRLEVSDASYTELASGLSIVDIDGQARAEAVRQGSAVRFDFAGSGPGQTTKTVAIDGELRLGEQSTLSSAVAMEGARLSAGPVASANVTGAIEIDGALDQLTASGDVRIDELNAEIATPESTGLVDIKVVAVGVDGEDQQTREPQSAQRTLTYDISLEADNQVFIRGRGVESEWRADIEIQGDRSDPLILGDMSLRRGWVDFAGRRFELTEGEVEFDRLSDNNPTVNMRAEYEADEITAAIVVSGRARDPKISLESTPPLPQDEIMALVLFGKPATELSAFESLQVAQALAQLGGIGPFGDGEGLTGSAREALGLDLLNLDLGADAGASSLTLGKYIADDVFVSATQDARGENGSVRIEYEITDSITVETELKQSGEQIVSGNWTHDF